MVFTAIRVMNLEQADTILKIAKATQHVVELDTYDHRGDGITDWVWSADYIRSVKWTVHYGWEQPTWSDDYGAIKFVAYRKGRCHVLTIQKHGWDWSERVLGSKYWN